nr:PepSY domain-containing protein [Halobacillus sp. A1]
MEERAYSISYEKTNKKPSKKTSIFRAIWRWHFYAGVFVAPFLIVLAVSGGLYLFKPQIESVLYQDHFFTKETAGDDSSLGLTEQLDVVKK